MQIIGAFRTEALAGWVRILVPRRPDAEIPLPGCLLRFEAGYGLIRCTARSADPGRIVGDPETGVLPTIQVLAVIRLRSGSPPELDDFPAIAF
jgi:hypothetical protein